MNAPDRGYQMLAIPRDWQPKCRPQDKRKHHDAREMLARMAAKLGQKVQP